jgi:hypothetical protein
MAAELRKGSVMFILLSLFLCAKSRAESRFALRLDQGANALLTSAQKQSLSAFLNLVTLKIPSKIRNELPKEIRVAFQILSNKAPDLSPSRCSLSVTEVSTIRDGEIIVDSALVPLILTGDHPTSPKFCVHQSGYRFAEAAVLHQVAKLYDRANIPSDEIKSEIQKCDRSHGSQGTERDPSCEIALGINRSVSKDPVFLTLLGDSEMGGLFPTRRVGERVSLRSPDPHEFDSPEEGFASNFEYFVLDPEYFCRRPSFFKFLSKRLEWSPNSKESCKINHVVPLSHEEVDSSMIRMVQLDPSRLYQVHYLFASKGSEMMSRWGHAMFRLVMCAPWRTKPGPECLEDLSYHVVVSFRANVQGIDIDSWKGLRGDYPSQLYLLSLVEVMREYNVDELRDLVSIPLVLSDQEKRDFLDRAIQLFWEYRGRYMFVSNNCATEALNLLKSVHGDPFFQKFTHVVTPLGLYDELKNQGLMDESVLADHERALESSYLLPSAKERLSRSYHALSASGAPSADLGDLPSYLFSSTASERKNWFENLTKDVSGKKRIALAAHFFVLESYLIRQRQAALLKEFGKIIESGEKSPVPINAKLSEKIARMRSIEESLSPAGLTSSGYGIAMPEDFRPNLEQDAKAAQKELIESMAEVRTALEAGFSSELRELILATQNRKLFALEMSAHKLAH